MEHFFHTTSTAQEPKIRNRRICTIKSLKVLYGLHLTILLKGNTSRSTSKIASSSLRLYDHSTHLYFLPVTSSYEEESFRGLVPKRCQWIYSNSSSSSTVYFKHNFVVFSWLFSLVLPRPCIMTFVLIFKLLREFTNCATISCAHLLVSRLSQTFSSA